MRAYAIALVALSTLVALAYVEWQSRMEARGPQELAVEPRAPSVMIEEEEVAEEDNAPPPALPDQTIPKDAAQY